MKDFNLSDKIMEMGEHTWNSKDGWIDALDVKEFIRLLKEEIHVDLKNEAMKYKFNGFFNSFDKEIKRKIDKFAGDKLK
jgi:hypothetical protein